MKNASRILRARASSLLPLDLWWSKLADEQVRTSHQTHTLCDDPLSRALLPPATCTPDGWPDTFCWTRMQTESGQQLDEIIRRKEAERQAGRGTFFWGIGNPLGNKIAMLRSRVSRPQVLFSVMKSKPKQADVTPGQVLLWTSSVDRKGSVKPLPEHVVVVSRGIDGDRKKNTHYALVCYSSEPLELHSRGSFDLSAFRNLESSNPRVGASQVTAVLERHTSTITANYYKVNIIAELVEPYFVRLAGAVPLTLDERLLLDQAADLHNQDADHWMSFARYLRAAALSRINRGDLFYR